MDVKASNSCVLLDFQKINSNFGIDINILNDGCVKIQEAGTYVYNFVESSILLFDGNFHNIRIEIIDNLMTLFVDDTEQGNVETSSNSHTLFGIDSDGTIGNNWGFGGGACILSDFRVYTLDTLVFEESFNNTTKGTVIGTEQYAIISSESREGISVQKTKRFTGTNTTEFEHTIQDFYYGGEITLASDSDVEKTFILIGYDDKKDAYYLFKKEKTTDSTVTFNPEDVYFRKLIIRITSETSTYFASYNMEHIFDIFSDAESVSCNSGLVDNFVYYNNVLIETRQVSFKVPKEYSNIANSLFSNKLYLDDVEYLVLGKNKGEFDIDNLIYNISFMRVFK